MKTASVSVAQKKIKLIDSLSSKDRIVAGFINMQESEKELSTQRLGQEIITNLVPKSLFARSFVDLCDNAFREIFENIIVYLGPKFVGENLFRKLYGHKLDKNTGAKVATTAADLIKENNPHNKTLIPIKGAIAISALLIPLAEYSVSYFKNLFTLKMFKQADFNNIANLNKQKNKQENTEHQQKVQDSAKKHITLAGGLFAGALGLSALLATKGKNSKALQSLSEAVLAPGTKFFRNNAKKEAFFNKYFGLDFTNRNGKLAISNGQITACVLAGFFGYTGAAKDRGKQDYKEVLYRFPLVGFYAISGNELFKEGLRSYLKKTGKCKEIFAEEAKTGKMPKLDDIEEMAIKLAAKNKTNAKDEYQKLFRQKATLIGVPALFGFTVMGLFVAGLSRYFTQYRYNHDPENQKITK